MDDKLHSIENDDLHYFFGEGHGDEIKENNVKGILAEIPGEADELDWHWVVELKDGKFGYLVGGCDYSGWGCQDWGSGHITETAEEAAKLADEHTQDWDNPKKPYSRQLLDQLSGKQPYALREA